MPLFGLVGPCALDYSKLRTAEHFWNDPPADELVQRHRISSGQFPTPASPPAHKRPGLHVCIRFALVLFIMFPVKWNIINIIIPVSFFYPPMYTV